MSQRGRKILRSSAIDLSHHRVDGAAIHGIWRGVFRQQVPSWLRLADNRLCHTLLHDFCVVRQVAQESEGGKFNKQVDASFRWGMSWFIFTEVMFFAAFFGALYYMRIFMSRIWAAEIRKCCGPTYGKMATSGPGIKTNIRRWARGVFRH